MANILLQPGEIFQHSHDHPSITRVISGTVKFYLAEQISWLQAGNQIFVPEHTSHRLENIGNAPAEIYCGHRVENGVPE